MAPARSEAANAAALPSSSSVVSRFGLLEGDPAAVARSHLPEDAARRAWKEGQTMTVDEVVALWPGGGP